MRYPLQAIQANRKWVFWPLLGTTLFLLVLLNQVGAPLTTPKSPYGIISYEFAGIPENAAAILNSWDANSQLRAAFSLGLDFLFLVLYSTTIGIACIWASEVLLKNRWPLAGVGIPLAWGLWLAALLDTIENVALTHILFNTPNSPWPELAAICALIKFGLIFIGIVYVFFALVVQVMHRYGKRGAN